ncbi:MAG TPA: hypothetical protein VJT31_13065 [Rugosimonospora sp.]|nr:hypothetical protein [Rugosimonospora sp.]
MPGSPVRVALRPIADLDPSEWAEIRDFGARYFEGDLVASIQTKREVVQLRGAGGRLVGIGAIDMFDVVHAQRTVTIIHGANAAFVDETRGQGYVHRVAFRYFLRAKRAHPRRPVYAAFSTHSWRSYLSLARSFRRFWPHRAVTLPAWEAGLYAQVGVRLDGDLFDPATGVAHRAAGRRLRPDVAEIPARLADDPDIRFFLARNAGHASGDGLLCLVPLTPANWVAAMRRIVWRRRRRPGTGKPGR